MNKLKLNIKENYILFFDMDGTLVDSDFANFLSYKNAIQSIIQTKNEITYNPKERFNRAYLTKVFPNLKKTEYSKIIQFKEENYKQYLSQTKLIKSVSDIIIDYSHTNKTVLVTNCSEERTLITLDYHNLTDKFDYIFSQQISKNGNRINKYKNAISNLSLTNQTIIVFENEEAEINNAIISGIPKENIYKI